MLLSNKETERMASLSYFLKVGILRAVRIISLAFLFVVLSHNTPLEVE